VTDPVSALVRAYAAFLRARLAGREHVAKSHAIRRLDQEGR
jgi:hypothetical protein